MTLSESAVVMISCYFDHKISKRRTNVLQSYPGLPCPYPYYRNRDKSAEIRCRTVFLNIVIKFFGK